MASRAPVALRLLAAAVAGVALIAGPALAAAPVPTAIGAGPRYRLPPAGPRALSGLPIGRLRCLATGQARARAHVELFAERRALLLPAGIGMAPPRRRRGADVVAARCSYPVRTTAPTGVVEFAPSARPTLADLFAVWGQVLRPTRLASFRGRVRAWVNGRPWGREVTAIPLRRHAEIVLEVGGYVPPHGSFLFPPLLTRSRTR